MKFIEIMFKSEYKDGLKGQHNLAQGKQSVALGRRTDQRIVHAITFLKGISLFRTKRLEPQRLPRNNELQFRPKEGFYPKYYILADGFSLCYIYPRPCLGLE